MVEHNLLSNITETELAYIAGLIDADGCISASKFKSKYSYVYVRVRVCMTDKSVIDFLASRVGGRTCIMKRRPPRRPIFQWQLCGRSNMVFLQRLHPYLLIKKHIAHLALELIEKQSGSYYNNEQEEIYLHIKFLNRKGINKLSN